MVCSVRNKINPNINKHFIPKYSMIDFKLLAKKHYVDIPYHNFKHALHVLENAKILIDRCKKYGIFVDEEVIEIAVLFHDAGYSEKTSHNSKEKYSSEIAEEELSKINYPKIKEVKKGIMATHKDAVPRTPEEKIVRASDLMGLSCDYETFRKNSINLAKEYKLLKNKESNIYEWIKLVNHYFNQKIILTPRFNTDGFHKKFKNNVKRYLSEIKTIP